MNESNKKTDIKTLNLSDKFNLKFEILCNLFEKMIGNRNKMK